MGFFYGKSHEIPHNYVSRFLDIYQNYNFHGLYDEAIKLDSFHIHFVIEQENGCILYQLEALGLGNDLVQKLVTRYFHCQR